MKLYLIFAVIGLVPGTKAMAGDIKDCGKLKITGRHECSFQGEKLILNINKLNGFVTVIAETDKEAFDIDGNEHARYSWSQDFTYIGSCSTKALTIESYNRGESEGTIVIAPKGPTITYSILKGAQKIVLDCKKLQKNYSIAPKWRSLGA